MPKKARRIHRLLGLILLARTEAGWRQLDVASGSPRQAPSEPDRIALFEDAIATNPERYGSIESIEEWTATTTTGVEISFDWKTMRFRQTGADTRRIDLLYRVHYLQWTGTGWGDRALPLVGLIGLTALALLGLRLVLRN